MFAVAYFACIAVGKVFHCLHVLHVQFFSVVAVCVCGVVAQFSLVFLVVFFMHLFT